jgi:putative aldouronate transport system permease protein
MKSTVRLPDQRVAAKARKQSLPARFRRSVLPNLDLYLLFMVPLAYFLIFKYYPMYGVQIAFKDFSISDGILGSEWIGFDHFVTFFNSYNFVRLLRNTIGLSLYQLIAGFPTPIILALAVNEVRKRGFRRFVQTVTYAPHFISMVVMVGMIVLFLSPRTGIVNHFIGVFGIEPVNFMARPEWFKTVYVVSDIWQNTGWRSIIFLAVLSSVDVELYDAARIDGASRLQKIWNIDIPALLPTATILLILDFGRIMNVGFQRVLLMQNPLNMPASDVIQTYIYRIGLIGAQYDYSAAIGLFNNVVNVIVLVAVNRLARRVSETSLW